MSGLRANVSADGEVTDHFMVDADPAGPLKRFIETYERLPCLWNSNHPGYKIRSQKRQAYNKLLKIYSTMKPGATLKDVPKKINTLRSNYRRLLKRVIDSKQSGDGEHCTYKPTNWVFYALRFLDNCEENVCWSAEEVIKSEAEESCPLPETGHPTAVTAFSALEQYQPVPMEQFQPSPVKTEPTESYKETPPHEFLETGEDEFATLAKVWAMKLRKIDPVQRIFVEKGVSDLFFEAELKTLHRNSVQINAPSTSTGALGLLQE